MCLRVENSNGLNPLHSYTFTLYPSESRTVRVVASNAPMMELTNFLDLCIATDQWMTEPD